MKIFFNRVPRVEPYGGGNQFLNGMTKYLSDLGHEVVYHLEKDIDLIFMMDPRPGDIGYSLRHIALYKQKHPNTKILHRVNECDKRKGTDGLDSLLLAGMSISDRVIFISEWLKSYFEQKGYNGSSEVVYNGCDLENFTPLEDKKDSKKLKLVTHHWSDNWMKGFDIYKALDEYIGTKPGSNLEFTYIGRYSKEYSPKNTKIVDPTFGKDLGDKLRTHDIYLTASRFEPCGMHHIEGSACGMPVLYHEEGGGINELCKNHGESFKDFDEFLVKLEKVSKSLKNYQDKIDRSAISLTTCIEKYAKIVQALN